MVRKPKTAKQMERHFKGAANHYRLDILMLVDREEGITVEEMVDRLKANVKTISQHTRSLTQAGLLQKRYQGRRVLHSLSPYGKVFVRWIKEFRTL